MDVAAPEAHGSSSARVLGGMAGTTPSDDHHFLISPVLLESVVSCCGHPSGGSQIMSAGTFSSWPHEARIMRDFPPVRMLVSVCHDEDHA